MLSRANVGKLRKNAGDIVPQYGPDTEGNYHAIQATKYNRYGKRGEGLSSVMDSEIIKKNLEAKRLAFNTGGYTFKMVGPHPENATLNIGGRIFAPRPADGSFRVVDNDLLKDIEDQYKERHEYIKGIVKKCAIADEVCSQVLGIEPSLLREICAPHGVEKVFGDQFRDTIGISQEVDSADCTPSFLDALNGDSITYAVGMAKLTKICLAYCPIVEGMTSEKVQEADTI